ncbi:MAG: outer membrane beta-barrel protein [Bacteroidales bacterium]|nr:outer membrane beta-barrel protein [Bacteroidales bacterium]
MKNTFFLLLFLASCFLSFAQMEVSTVKESRDPWKFGVGIGATYDWVNQPRYIDKVFGLKAGVSGEKHLVYNLYFRPTFNLWKKGYEANYTNASVKVDGFFLDFEATLELKFGDERLGRGLVFSLTPFLTYGVAGNTKIYNENSSSEDYDKNIEYTGSSSKTVKTFADGNLHKEDVGYIFGVGYDINHSWEFTASYTMGFVNIGRWNNYRWRGWGFGITYFFVSDKKRH